MRPGGTLASPQVWMKRDFFACKPTMVFAGCCPEEFGNERLKNNAFSVERQQHEYRDRDLSGEGERIGDLRATWRISTRQAQTADEYGILIRNLLQTEGVDSKEISGVVIASVVPPVDWILRQFSERYFNHKPLFIEPGVKTGLPILTDNPGEVGADRVANCVGAFQQYGGPCIVVDFGTATNFDVVSKHGEFLGGAIAPGVNVAAEALFARAARLPRVEIKRPPKVIGTNTVDNLQIGLFYGHIGLVDGILERMIAELGKKRNASPPEDWRD